MNTKNQRMSSCKFSTRLFVALIAVAYALPVIEAPAGTLTPLGHLPDALINADEINGVSADGSVVVGDSGGEAFRWTSGGGIVGLGVLGEDPSGFIFSSYALGASRDGSVVVGRSSSSNSTNEAFRWTSGGGMVGLGDLSDGVFSSLARSVSADGSVIVGSGNSASGTEAFIWTSGGGMVGLGDFFGGGVLSIAYDVSPDGSVIVGRGTTGSGSQAFRWTSGGGMVSLGDLPGGGSASIAFGISADGSVIVGRADGGKGPEAFRWTSGGGMVALGDLPGRTFWSEALDVSADGSVIVGFGHGDAGKQATIWTATSGMRRVQDALTDLGIDLNGFSELGPATGVSDDGRTLVGTGFHEGRVEGFVADLNNLDLHWTNTESGNWTDGGNWTSGLYSPIAGDDVSINPVSGLIVTGPAFSTAVQSLTIGATTSGFAELRLQPRGNLNVIEGTTIANRGRLSGSGILGFAVTIESGGEVLVLTGDSLGFSDPVSNAGTINVIGGTLSFRGDGIQNGDGLTNNGTMNLINATINGDVHSPSGSTINVASGVVFNGLVSGAANFPGAGLVTFNGGYDPGDSPAVIDFNSDITFGSGNSLTIELAGLLSGEFDQLQIAGDATLDGNLVVNLLDGFTLGTYNEFEILDVAGTLSGEFTGLGEGAMVGNFGGEDLFISYTAGDGNDVALFTGGLLGDFDFDGDVDGADFLLWQRGGSPTSQSASDLADWQTNYGNSTAPLASSQAVPEPSTLALLAMGLLGFCRRGQVGNTQ